MTRSPPARPGPSAACIACFSLLAGLLVTASLPARAQPAPCPCWPEGVPLVEVSSCFVSPGTRINTFANLSAPPWYLQATDSWCRNNAITRATGPDEAQACDESLRCLCASPGPGPEQVCSGADEDCNPATPDEPPGGCPAPDRVDTLAVLGDVNAVGRSTAARVALAASPRVARAWNAGTGVWERTEDPLHDDDPNPCAPGCGGANSEGDSSPWPQVANRWRARDRDLEIVASARAGSRLVGPTATWDPASTSSLYDEFRADLAAAATAGDLDLVAWSGGNHDVEATYREYRDALVRLADRLQLDFPDAPLVVAPLTSRAHAGVDPRWVSISRAQWDVIRAHPHVHLGPSQDDGLAYATDGGTVEDVAALGDRWYRALWGRLHGRTWYVDAAGGDDLADGLSEATAWGAPDASPATHPANAVPRFGDTVMIRGDQPAFAATFGPVASGSQGAPITYRGYGATPPVVREVPGASPCLSPLRSEGPVDWIVYAGLTCEQPADRPLTWVSLQHDEDPGHAVRFLTIEDSSFLGGDGGASDGFRLLRPGGVEHASLRNLLIDPNPIANEHTDLVETGDSTSHLLVDSVTITDGGHNALRFKGPYCYLRDSVIRNPGQRALELAATNGETVRNDFCVIDSSRIVGGGTVKPSGAIQANGRRTIVRRSIVATEPGSQAPIRPFASFADLHPDVSGWRIYHNTIAGSGGGREDEGGISHGLNREHPGDGDMAWLNNALVGNGGLAGSAVQFYASFGGLGSLGSPAGRLRGNLLWGGAPGLDVIQVKGSGCGGDDDTCSVAQAEAWFASFSDNLDAPPGFCDDVDFALAAGSPAIDAGVWLTSVASEATDAGARSVRVADDRVFSDGNWNPAYSVPVADGDRIRFEDGQTAVVLWIDRDEGTLWLDRPLVLGSGGLRAGAGVALDYSGTRPDVGAVEHTGSPCPAAGSPGCGLGTELALLLGPLAWLRRRGRRG